VNQLTTYAVFSFANFVDAELSLTSTQFFLVLQLMVNTLSFSQRSQWLQRQQSIQAITTSVTIVVVVIIQAFMQI